MLNPYVAYENTARGLSLSLSLSLSLWFLGQLDAQPLTSSVAFAFDCHRSRSLRSLDLYEFPRKLTSIWTNWLLLLSVRRPARRPRWTTRT